MPRVSQSGHCKRWFEPSRSAPDFDRVPIGYDPRPGCSASHADFVLKTAIRFLSMRTKSTLRSRQFGVRMVSHAHALLAVSALAALAVPNRSLAQAFNTLVTTPTGSAP